ncbi:DUF6431 domain-containing protein [Pseudonocardia sp. RS010]|uniref:DUF6431 domain-containing protein n=1 Tax=Pseudonocardia sp. RS010 TaxID=3385979 RepID=UPI0039A3E269
MDAGRVEHELRSGELACPGCGDRLSGWGRARTRSVRDERGIQTLTPRRTRCVGCGATHVLLPLLVLVRRADAAAVILAALCAKAAGRGHRAIAAELCRPAETVRGWLRCFGARLEPARAVFTRWCRALAPDLGCPANSGPLYSCFLCCGLLVQVFVADRVGCPVAEC